MTEFRFERKKENVEDYLKVSLFRDNFAHKLLIAVLGICLLAIAVSGIVMFINFDSVSMLIITIVAVVLAVAYPVFLKLFIVNITKKLTKPNPEEEGVTIAVSENDILLIKNNLPCGMIEWKDITEITEGRTGFFLTEKNGALIILGKGSVSSGTYDEAVQVLSQKRTELTKDSKK